VSILVLTPRDDTASKRCAAWADRLAAKFGAAVEARSTRVRSEVEVLLREHRNVIYFGHGEIHCLVVPRTLFRKRRVLVDVASLTQAPERVVVAVACWSGEGLAQAATDAAEPNRALSYLGWRDEVSWPPEWPHPIGDAVVEGVGALLDGGTVGECSESLRVALDRSHDEYRRVGPGRMSVDGVIFGKMCAKYWRERMVVEGDRAARLW
jgi:hypothetical protein